VELCKRWKDNLEAGTSDLRNGRCLDLFIYGLFNDAVSSSDCTASNDRMINN
jgi:hypothetical protein